MKHKDEFRLVHSESMVEPLYVKRYKFRKTAQNAADKLNAKRGLNLKVYSGTEYAALTKGKGEWRISAYDGKTRVWVALGTPLCCDPSSETYWSM